jgi:hypothetical protein
VRGPPRGVYKTVIVLVLCFRTGPYGALTFASRRSSGVDWMRVWGPPTGVCSFSIRGTWFVVLWLLLVITVVI